jgi:hypothetical protein
LKNVNLGVSTDLGHLTDTDVNTPLEGRIEHKNAHDAGSSPREAYRSAEHSTAKLQAIR